MVEYRQEGSPIEKLHTNSRNWVHSECSGGFKEMLLEMLLETKTKGNTDVRKINKANKIWTFLSKNSEAQLFLFIL